jgi:hypothetical protein
MAAEQLAEFKTAFAASVSRRRLTRKQVKAALRERVRVDALYRLWLKTVSPDDVRLMLVIDDVVEVIETARGRGYRTPHK